MTVLSYLSYMFHSIPYYFMLYRMHIHTSIPFILYFLLYLFHLYTSFLYSNIATSLSLSFMSNNISRFHSIMTSHHLPSTLYLYLHSSNLYYYYSFILQVLSYPIYIFHSIPLYFMLHHMHIIVSIMFTLCHVSQSLHLYMLFHYSNIVPMLHSLFMSNNTSLHLFMTLNHSHISLYLYFHSSNLYYYSLHLRLALSYLYSSLLSHNFMYFTQHLVHRMSYFHSHSLSMSLDSLPYYLFMSNYIYLDSSLSLSLLMLHFHLSMFMTLDSAIYYMTVLSYLSYMFNNFFTYFTHYQLHIHATPLFTPHLMLLYLNLYKTFHYSYTVYMW